MSAKNSFLLYFDIREPLELLSDAERGRLFLAILNYAESGELPNFDGAVKMAFSFIKKSIDRDAAKWESVCQKRAEAGRIGGLARVENQRQSNQANALFDKQNKQNQSNQADNVPLPDNVPVCDNVPVPDIVTGGSKGVDKPPKKSARFSPPTVNKVEEYCAERKNNIKAQTFIDFYETSGWKLSSGIAMKDWRAAIRNWENREKKHAAGFSYNDTCKEGDSL